MSEKRDGRGHFAKDISGQRFGRLVVVRRDGFRNKRAQWLCVCDCGNQSVANGPNLKNGHTVSCGCRKRETRNTGTHGLSMSKEYKSYQLMRARTGNKRNIGYADYGGRGIKCRYESFEQFYADVGPKPTACHSLGRINNDGDYGPGNCRWETAGEQANNKRNTRLIEFNGERMSCKQWSQLYGLKRRTLAYRLDNGWPVALALSTPLGTLRRGRDV